MLCKAGGLRFYDRAAAQMGLDIGSCGRIIATMVWHKPKVAFEPK